MVLLTLGCPAKRTAIETKDKAEKSRHEVARIVFTVPGDDIGAQESQKILEEIKAALLANKVGTLVSSGYGMGTMEVVVALNSNESTEEIRRVLGDVYPKGKYRVEQSAR
jgi:hypothetical protein